MSTHAPQTVQDTSGITYELGRQLGSGGQGAVYAVKGRPLAIKLIYDPGGPRSLRRLEERIAAVRRMPLDDLPVARPLRTLCPPHTGYVMELMTDMEPMEVLLSAPRDQEGDISGWYLASGSLRRRLRCLARAAEVLSSLHGLGIAYGDLSPGNVFVSVDHEREDVWLIDCDNLVFGVSPRPFYTPGYGAPELFRGHSASSLTDAWSFTTLAFQTLAILHPFIGDEVDGGPPELEERALRAELPWVDHPSGENEATHGLPRSMVLTRGLVDHARACFESSVDDPTVRPGVAAWARSLRLAADQIVVCPDCQSSYYLNQPTCPWCDQPRPTIVTGTLYLRDPALRDEGRNPFNLVCKEPGRPSAQHRLVIQADLSTTLEARHLGDGARGYDLKLTLSGTSLQVTGSQDCAFLLQDGGRKRLKLRGTTQTVGMRQGGPSWWLTPAEATALHRVIRLDLHPGEAA